MSERHVVPVLGSDQTHRGTLFLRTLPSTEADAFLFLKPNGGNLTGGGTGNSPSSSPSYIPFNGGGSGALPNVQLGANILLSLGLGVVGVAIGLMSTLSA